MFKVSFWILVVLVILGPTRGTALSWQDAISSTDERVESLWGLAKQRGLEGRHIGTLYNELHIPEHRCSILGRMLGQTHLIHEIEKSTEIDVSTTDGHATGVAAQSLSNWSFSARSLLDIDEARRVREWNLDCVGHLGIPEDAFIGEARSATFYDVQGNTLRIMGDVETGFAEKLRAAIVQNPQVEYVALGSGGGSVAEALAAGRHIRELGLVTTLWNNCYSACTLVFIGGTKRTIWSPYSELSFHQVSRGGEAVSFDDEVYFRIAQYVADMGVDVDAFMGLTLSAPPSSFTTPPVGLLCQPNITTWVQRVCGF